MIPSALVAIGMGGNHFGGITARGPLPDGSVDLLFDPTLIFGFQRGPFSTTMVLCLFCEDSFLGLQSAG